MDRLFVVLTSSYDETTYLGLYDDIELAKKAAQHYGDKCNKVSIPIEWTDDIETCIHSKNTYESFVIIPSTINEYEEI